jgi:hypothetical protein
VFDRQIKTEPLLASKKMSVSTRANGKNGCHSSSERLPWYFAQRALPELKYVLTISGYVLLS